MDIGLQSFQCTCGRMLGKDYLMTERIKLEGKLNPYYRWTCQNCGQMYVEQMKDAIDLTPRRKEYGVLPPEEPSPEPPDGEPDGGESSAKPIDTPPPTHGATVGKRRTKTANGTRKSTK